MAQCKHKIKILEKISGHRKWAKKPLTRVATISCINLGLEHPIQYYLWRWDIEVNHRDEKQIIGVGQAQVRSEKSVDRQPALAVASYAMLLLAAENAFGNDAVSEALPLPKWQHGVSRQRLSTEKLIQLLRNEVWSCALDQIDAYSSDFVLSSLTDAKSQKLQLPLASNVLYANAG